MTIIREPGDWQEDWCNFKPDEFRCSCCDRLEISSDISSIWSRHSFATQMKRNNVSPYIIQEAFGHRDIKTTENYMSSLLEDDMRNIQKKL